MRREDQFQLVQLAKQLVEKKQYQAALEVYNKLIKENKNAVTLANMARCHEMLANLDQALLLFQEARQLAPDDLKVLRQLAILHEKRREFGAAIKVYETIFTQPLYEKTLHEIKFAQAVCYAMAGEHQKRVEILRSLPRGDLNTLMSLAHGYEKLREHDKAIKTFEDCLKLKPHHHAALHGLALAYEKRGDTLQACAMLEKLPKTSQVRLSLARNYNESQRHEEALMNYQLALSEDPNNPETKLNLAICYQKMKCWEESFSLLQTLEITPEVTRALVKYYIATNQYDLALTNCAELISYSKEPGLSLKAAILARKKEFSAAIQTITAVSSYQKKPELLNTLAQIYVQQGNFTKAIEIFEAALEIASDDRTRIDATLSLAITYEKTEQYDKAVSLLVTVKDNQDRKLLLTLGRCYQLISRYEEAKKIFLSLKNSKLGLCALAGCFTKMGLNEEALRHYKEAEQRWPNNITIAEGIVHSYLMLCENDKAINYATEFSQRNQGHLRSQLLLMHCYIEVKSYVKAESFYQNLRKTYPNSVELRLKGAELFIAAQNYQKALNQLTSIQGNVVAQPLIARCEQRLNHYEQALAIYETLLAQDSYHKEALMGKAECHQLQGHHELAREAYFTLLDRYPDCSQSKWKYLSYLMSQEEFDQINIEPCLARWPYQVKFYLLQASLHKERGDSETAFKVLTQTTQQFPYYRDSWLQLIHYLLKENNFDEAAKVQELCARQFQYYPRFIKTIAYLMKNRNIFANTPSIPYGFKGPLLTFPITAELQPVFKLLRKVNNSFYLVGSCLLNLIQKEPMQTYQDVDVIISTAFPEKLVRSGFARCLFINNLYQAWQNDRMIDCMVIGDTDSKSSLALGDVTTRDFTIACLFGKPNKQEIELYDPTGFGLIDAQNKVLRIIGVPSLKLREDPVRILRLLKYQLMGYQPTDELAEAVRNWRNDNYKPDERFKFLLNKLLEKYGSRYSTLLKEYGLVKNLLGLDPEKGEDELMRLTGLLVRAENKEPVLIEENKELLSNEQIKHSGSGFGFFDHPPATSSSTWVNKVNCFIM